MLWVSVCNFRDKSREGCLLGFDTKGDVVGKHSTDTVFTQMSSISDKR